MSTARAAKRLKTENGPVDVIKEQSEKKSDIDDNSKALHQLLSEHRKNHYWLTESGDNKLEEKVKALIQKGASVHYSEHNSYLSYSPCTTFLLAILIGNPNIIKLVLDQEGVDINQKFAARSGYVTPLLIAAESCSYSTVKALLEYKNPPNLEAIYTGSGRHMTALLIAADELQVDILKSLLEHKANPKAKSTWGGNALNYAAEAYHRMHDECQYEIKRDERRADIKKRFDTIVGYLAPILKDEPVITRPFVDESEYKKITGKITEIVTTEKQKESSAFKLRY